MAAPFLTGRWRDVGVNGTATEISVSPSCAAGVYRDGAGVRHTIHAMAAAMKRSAVTDTAAMMTGSMTLQHLYWEQQQPRWHTLTGNGTKVIDRGTK
jgi:hypothetical protein